eukprot:m.39941 g.39941  ORF g.39941 m.39941 type:complete len:718 (+) comp13808_c1_seq1:62-2215(+)
MPLGDPARLSVLQQLAGRGGADASAARAKAKSSAAAANHKSPSPKHVAAAEVSDADVPACVGLTGVVWGGDSAALRFAWRRGVVADPVRAARGAGGAGTGRIPLAHSYRLLVKAEHDENFKVLADMRDLHEDHEFIAKDLLPSTRYEAYVETYSIPLVFPGSGAKSISVTCRTAEGAPSEPPANLHTTDVGLDHVSLAWNPPTVHTGTVLGYRLFFDVDNTDSYTEVELPATATAYTATLLDPDMCYRFQVLAFTSAGEGPTSDILVCHTLESAMSRMKRITTGGAAPSHLRPPSPSPNKPVSRRGSYRSNDAPTSISDSDTEANAASTVVDQAEWQRLRHTGEHRLARPLIESWVKSDGSQSDQSNRPTPQALHVSRPSGATPAFQPAHGAPLKQSSTPSVRSTWAGSSVPDVSTPWARGTVPMATQSMGDRFLEQLKTGPVNYSEDCDEDGPTSGADGGVERSPSGPPDGKSGKGSKGNWIVNPKKIEAPAPAPPQIIRQTSKRVITAAEQTGEAVLVAIEGNIRVHGEIRGKRNAVRAKLEVMMERTKPIDEKAAWLQGLFEEENACGALVMYTTSNTVIRQTYSTCNEILKLFDLMRLKIRKRDVYLDTKVAAELQERCPGASVPVVFASGVLLGNATKILELNETGELKRLLKGYADAPTADCGACGGVGYVVCTWCQGSLKSRTISTGPRSNAELRCTVCNENGLQRCPRC